MQKIKGMKMMKNRLCYLIPIFFVCMLVSGCRLIHVDEQKMPEATQQEVEMAMSKYLPKESAPIYLNSPKKQVIIRKDLDGDGVSEGVTIFTKENQPGKYEILIIKRNQKRQWEKWNQFSLQAKRLSLVGLKDVTHDRRPELILTVQKDQAKQESLVVYQLQAHKARLLLNRTYDEKVIDDFQRDGTYEIVLFQVQRDLKRKVVQTRAELFNYRGKSLVVIDRQQLEGEAKKGNIHSGKVSPQTRGIYVDLAVGSRGGGTTVLLIPKKSVLLQKIDPGRGLYSYKLINESSRDINRDGILEFVLMEQPKGTEKMPATQLPYVYNWYQWENGRGRNLVQQTYEDLNFGFRLQYLDRWLGKVKVETDRRMNQVTFYYGLVNQPIKKEWKLFILKRYHQNEWNKQLQAAAKGKQQNQPVLLKKSGAFVYAAILPTAQERARFKKIKQQQLIPTKEELSKQLVLLTKKELKNKLAHRAKVMSKHKQQ